jgi:hypothetical protein
MLKAGWGAGHLRTFYADFVFSLIILIIALDNQKRM